MWNDTWRDELKSNHHNCWIRLCECRNTFKDVVIMSKLLYRYNPDKLKEDCLDRIIEWVTSWNSQYELEDKLFDKYNYIISVM